MGKQIDYTSREVNLSIAIRITIAWFFWHRNTMSTYFLCKNSCTGIFKSALFIRANYWKKNTVSNFLVIFSSSSITALGIVRMLIFKLVSEFLGPLWICVYFLFFSINFSSGCHVSLCLFFDLVGSGGWNFFAFVRFFLKIMWSQICCYLLQTRLTFASTKSY